jgi:type IV pilus assembly protein PilY1|tara:strand:- start:342 stop:4910 length:4569 start_codon:yes stop_codon:yes gene_type:complete
MYKKFLKIIISNLFIALVVLNQNAISKPLPPGSGSGDVPANILILLDSSASMRRPLISGSGIAIPNDIVEDVDGNLIVAERNYGFIKILTADNTVDRTFANNNRNFKGNRRDSCQIGGRQDSRVKVIQNLSYATNVSGTTDDVIYGNDKKGKIVGINKAGECVEVIYPPFAPYTMEVRTINSEDHLFTSGVHKTGRRGPTSVRFYTKNLTTGVESNCGGNFSKISSLGRVIQNTSSDLTVDNAGEFIYYTWNGSIYGYNLTSDGSNFCPTDDGTFAKEYVKGTTSSTHRAASAIQVSPESNSVIYIASGSENVVQRVSLTSTSTLTSVTLAGRSQNENNTANAGALAAANVNFTTPNSLFVSSSTVWVSDRKATIQEFTENNFTAANIDTSWQNEYGGSIETRFAGAKKAINAVVTDTSLTSGANFGYGHWNSGELGRGKGNRRTVGKGLYCHRYSDNCDYYRGWIGNHPEGTSSLCNSDSCLSVGISKEGHAKIPAALEATGLEWGTDGNAFAQMAYEYFNDSEVDIIDEDSDCQLNYVIVIGDGEWMHSNQAEEKIKLLRTGLGVKTIVVAYGGGIKASGLDRFDRMAIAGSCDGAGSEDCEAKIVADTPQMLKTQLQSKIQQIIAEKISFTAPSITATIQEGGSLYQAQFNYVQFGEWEGTIVRKNVNGDGSLNLDANDENWDAAKKLKDKGSIQRKIWTVLPAASYLGNWNNWKEENKSEIKNLFDQTGNTIIDYHNATSNCSSTSGVETGTNDDLKGLINFVRGQDYFDYNGNCNITEDRAHLLGDIYHSQLVEVGPPDANSGFTDVNQESYWRAKNNYQSFSNGKQLRQNVLYAGSNDGILHAFNATTGEEEWGFIPPFIASKLPVIINSDYDGRFDGKAGGTNPIFGVDGSPIIHDMYIKGLKADGTFEESKSWHTILMIPYGRGGAGFSVLDVTNPIVNGGEGPLHMYSIFNDAINSKVLVADNDGFITEHSYSKAAINISNSEEAILASANQEAARAADSDDCEASAAGCTNQAAIKVCQTNTEASQFRIEGTAACFKGQTFVFNIEVPSDGAGNVSQDDLVVTEKEDGEMVIKNFTSAKMISGFLHVDFGVEKIFNVGTGDDVTNSVVIQTSCEGSGTDLVEYDYSQLGETWSTPRIFRIPTAAGDTSIDNDTYVAVMGGGMGNTFICSGSNVFLVDLENIENPGSIFGAEANNGSINIIDTDSSDIANAIPASPVVITPDLSRGIPWRGAMVYFNDLEGKITKINLTNQTKNGAKLYNQTTLFKLNATVGNGRYSYQSMDATIGKDTNNFWLFGGTGDHLRLGDSGKGMDNILYGIKDENFPYFKHLNSVEVPDELSDGFVEAAKRGAEAADHIDDEDVCVNTTSDTSGDLCPNSSDKAWVIHLDTQDDMPVSSSANRYRKVSAPPTVYKGNVFYPIYQPPAGVNKCNIGKAYLCSADDECGTNNSSELGAVIAGDDCLFVRRGILSELTIFADTLYGNVAGPSVQEDTLFILSTNAGEVTTYRKSWRENY